MHEIQFVRNEQDIRNCWEVVAELRPHLEKEKYVQQAKQMLQEGYQAIFISLEENQKAVAYAGFRNQLMLHTGPIIYIDDLGTLANFRGKGYAGQLLDYIHQLAKDTGKNSVHLDSGYHRQDAHRLYLNKGYILSSHHFAHKLK